MPSSRKYSLNGDDLAAVGRGALIAAAGAIVTYVGTEVLPNLEQDTALGGLIGALAATAINVLRKFLAEKVETQR